MTKRPSGSSRSKTARASARRGCTRAIAAASNRCSLPQCGRACERRQRLLDERQHCPHTGGIVVPGEVDREEVALVGAAQPELVGCRGAQLAHEQDRLDVVGQRVHRPQRRRSVGAGDEVLALDLVAEGRLAVEAEVRQAREPRSGHAAELGEVGQALERVGLDDPAAVQQHVRHRIVVRVEPGLDPDVAEQVGLPPREDRHAVAGAGDLVEPLERGIPRHVAVDVLPCPIRGLHGERQRDDHAERAHADRERIEVGVALPHLADIAVGADEADAADRAREHAVRVARPVRAGRRRPADRDVRQRTEVVQRPPAFVEPQRELAVAGAGGDLDGRGIRVEGEPAGESCEVDQRAGRVGQIGERVARAERVHRPAGGERRLHLFDRRCADDPRCGVLVRSGPVPWHAGPFVMTPTDATGPSRSRGAAEAVAMCTAIADAAASSSPATTAR